MGEGRISIALDFTLGNVMSSQLLELDEILERIKTWPMAVRIRLARRVLESVDSSVVESRTGGWRAADAIAAVNSRQPAPDDQTVKQWLDEHRMEKYGQ
jgi:hypothetical protein